MHDNYRYAENIFEELTEAGEWYFDAAAHRIYVIPYPEDAPEDAEIAVSHCFFELNGCEHITIENLTFARSSRTFMQTREPLLRSDWTIFRGGAVRMENVRDVTLDRCTFTDIGSNAVFVSGACEDVRVTRCHFNGSGVCFIGLPECVRNPLFEYNETLPFSELDLTPGPQTEQYPRRCLVEDCLISRTGQVEKQSAGVQISMASEICVRNSKICHTPRAGINISEGTFGGHRIEGCDVFDTVRETGDHGSFNSWGRDRFWHAEGLRDEDVHCYAKLDCIKPNVIRTSRFRCDHGWDIDLDDGSSNYIIEHNLCLSGGIKLREGCFRTVRRNITVNNTVHFHVWYPDSHDIVTDNIVFILYAPIGMPECWGTCVDHNILHTPGMTASAPALTLQSLSGQDSTSVMLDCMFQNPETGDFIPLSDSALLSGFAEFPREFGVRYAPLRAIADTPDMTLSTEHREETVFVRQWHGAYVKNITSDGEMSVYGTAGHNGVLVLAVSDGTDACEYGLCSGDVIVDVAGTPVSSVDDLTENLIQPITVLRRQMHIVLEKIG